MKIVWREPRFDLFFYNPRGEVGRYIAKRAKLVESAAKAQVGSKKGMLRSSIHMRHSRDTRGQYVLQTVFVGSPLDYAYIHHEGTGPRLIVPTKRRTLRFFSKGAMFYTKMVRHPGTRPNRFLTNNLKLIK